VPFELLQFDATREQERERIGSAGSGMQAGWAACKLRAILVEDP
jgi:hypothetical protein